MKRNKRLKQGDILVLWGAGATSFVGYRTFQTFPELFWPTRDKRSVLQINSKEELLLNNIHLTLMKRKSPTTLDSYLRIIHEYFSITEKLQSETILRDDLELPQPLLWSNLTDLNERLTNLRFAICRLTAEHYTGNSIELVLEQNISSRFANGCMSLIKFFDLIHKMSNDEKEINLFTTNYDIFMERLFWMKDNAINNIEQSVLKHAERICLDNEFYAMTKTKSNLKLDIGDSEIELNKRKLHKIIKYISEPDEHSLYNVGRLFCPNPKYTIKISRLHGCIAWIRGKVGDSNIYFSITDPKNIESYHERLCIYYPGHEDSLSNPPYVDFWRRFSEKLDTATILIVVGFAFRDPDVLNLIGKRMSISKKPLKLIIIDPLFNSVDSLLPRMERCTKDYCPPAPFWEKLLTNPLNMPAFIQSIFPLDDNKLQALEKIIIN